MATGLFDTDELPGFQLADAETWSAPVIDVEALPGTRRKRKEEEEAELRAEEKRLYADAEARGIAAGHAAGLAAAKGEIEARNKALDELAAGLRAALDSLSRPLAHVDDVVHEQVATLAVQLARALVRRELRIDPTQVIGIVRDTVALLPAATRGVRVALNREDAALVREKLSIAGPESAWTIVDDPALARGDCRVYTDYGQIDARVETRLKEALAALLGDERARSRDGGEA